MGIAVFSGSSPAGPFPTADGTLPNRSEGPVAGDDDVTASLRAIMGKASLMGWMN